MAGARQPNIRCGMDFSDECQLSELSSCCRRDPNNAQRRLAATACDQVDGEHHAFNISGFRANRSGVSWLSATGRLACPDATLCAPLVSTGWPPGSLPVLHEQKN